MIITAEMLRKAGVHEDEVTQLTLFYGEHVDVTEAWALEHAHDDIDWLRAAEYLLPASVWRAYGEAKASAGRVYVEDTEPAWRVYKEAAESARRALCTATASAQRAAAWGTYKEAADPAWRAYKKACALAFARALNA